MPHVIIKLWPGRSDDQKQRLTDQIVKAFKDTMDIEERSLSVSFEEIQKEKWTEEVYVPDILNKEETLYKKPGYSVKNID